MKLYRDYISFQMEMFNPLQLSVTFLFPLKTAENV